METNVGETDRLARIAIGAIAGAVSLAILAGAVDLSELISLVLGIVAILMLGTGLTSKCAVYSALGMSTK